MSVARTYLAGIKERAEKAPDLGFIARAQSENELLRTDLPRVADALLAVLAIADRLNASMQVEDREIAEDLHAAITEALEATL
jgi:hypothetical protein